MVKSSAATSQQRAVQQLEHSRTAHHEDEEPDQQRAETLLFLDRFLHGMAVGTRGGEGKRSSSSVSSRRTRAQS